LAEAILVRADLAGTIAADRKTLECLLEILRIPEDSVAESLYVSFLKSISGVLPESALAFVAQRTSDGTFAAVGIDQEQADNLSDFSFLPGEGPPGQCGATGRIVEQIGKGQVRESWAGLDPANADLLNTLFGEAEHPDYSVCLPVPVLGNVEAVIVVFDRGVALRSQHRATALRLAGQLLAVKLTVAKLSQKAASFEIGEPEVQLARLLNHLNNDLATVLGRAELVQKSEDIPGPIRYTVEEILKAAEAAADKIRQVQTQKGNAPPVPADEAEQNVTVGNILRKHRVTGNLYMFGGDQAVTLEARMTEDGEDVSLESPVEQVLETLLGTFAALVQEGEAMRLQTDIRDGGFYITLLRQAPEVTDRFSPEVHEFGEPDVIPESLLPKSQAVGLAAAGGEVSFDRFGRNPTYVSVRISGKTKTSDSSARGSVLNQTAGLRVLAIDDQQMILDLLSSICQSLGIELTAVQDPNEGTALFDGSAFDIVMTDLAMGSMSGWDVARRIKEKSPETPVILMTGWGIQFSEDETSRGGVDFTLTKPFKIENLTDVIAQARARRISS
jgi:CheY-like chemotaxis protein